MNANAQIFLDYLTAAATSLAGVAWIDLHDTTPGAFSLVRGELDKLVPCRVCDGLGETMILEHPAYVEIFKYDECKSIDQLAALLMGKVAALIRDAFVYVRDCLTPFAALWTAFLGGAQFLLSLCQPLFFGAKESRICNGFPVRQHGKFFQAHVYARRLGDDRQRLMLDFCREASEPFARSRAGNGERLYLALNRAMQLDFDLADFRQLEFARLDSKTGLRIGEAVVSSASAETRKAGFLACFDSAKESIKGFVQSPENVLQYLRVNHAEFGANRFDFWQLVLLIFIADGFVSDAPCVPALLQSGVVEFRTKPKRAPKCCDLSAAWIDAIFERLEHLLDPLRFDVFLDDFQRCAANRDDKVRRTPQMPFPEAIAKGWKLTKQLVSRRAFEPVYNLRQRITRLASEHDMDVVNLSLYGDKLTVALFENVRHHLFEPVTYAVRQDRTAILDAPYQVIGEQKGGVSTALQLVLHLFVTLRQSLDFTQSAGYIVKVWGFLLITSNNLVGANHLRIERAHDLRWLQSVKDFKDYKGLIARTPAVCIGVPVEGVAQRLRHWDRRELAARLIGAHDGCMAERATGFHTVTPLWLRSHLIFANVSVLAVRQAYMQSTNRLSSVTNGGTIVASKMAKRSLYRLSVPSGQSCGLRLWLGFSNGSTFAAFLPAFRGIISMPHFLGKGFGVGPLATFFAGFASGFHLLFAVTISPIVFIALIVFVSVAFQVFVHFAFSFAAIDSMLRLYRYLHELSMKKYRYLHYFLDSQLELPIIGVGSYIVMHEEGENRNADTETIRRDARRCVYDGHEVATEWLDSWRTESAAFQWLYVPDTGRRHAARHETRPQAQSEEANERLGNYTGLTAQKIRQALPDSSTTRRDTMAVFAHFRGLRQREIPPPTKGRGLLSQFDNETRARSLLSLGAAAHFANEPESARRFYHEATQFTCQDNPLLSFQVQKNYAITCALDGANHAAMRLLESIYPMARHLARFETVGYLDYLNSRSLISASLGRFADAEDDARILVRFGQVFPTGVETANEIAEMHARHRRSHRLCEVILPGAAHSPAKVFQIQDRINVAEYYRNKRQLFRASVDETLPPCIAKLGADATSKLRAEDAPAVQGMIDGIIESRRCNQTPAAVVKLEQSK